MVQKICKFCGKKFEAKRVTAEFCSDNHRVQWNSKKKPKPPTKGTLADFLKSDTKDTEPPKSEGLSYLDRLRNIKMGIKNT